MPVNKKQTSASVATLASETLRDPKASKTAHTLAASALAQAGTTKQTGSKIESLASTVLQSNKYSADTKTLAGTVLSQSNKKR